jgi:5-oxoprolinase (ATP-hydrolysing)
MSNWKIWIDTGGTFTDCIATGPAGKTWRTKVLSSSSLRGILTERLSPTLFRFTHQWGVAKDIFQGYQCHLMGHPAKDVSVGKVDFKNGIIELPAPPDAALTVPLTFEITAGEEAPVLAARLVTLTPLNQPLPPIEMRLGSTKGTNALLEKKGARTAFLTTRGFRDLVHIGTQQRPGLFQLNIPEPELLYARVIEVEERVDARGEVLEALTDEELERLLAALREAGVQSVAVALLHAWKNPVHEQLLKAALENAGFVFISLSHELMPAIKILPRAQTAIVDAYLKPLLHDYLTNVKSMLSGSRLRVMTSAGGLVAGQHFSPKDSLLSGPAGGVVGAAAVARTLGFQKIITLDMGGTSTDTARFDGHFDYDYITRIGSLEMASPCLAIETVAAGGGSICWFDGNKLCVGPESAGAAPGPACYGAGGPLTLTDVNLLLEKLDPAAMGIPVDAAPARAAMEAVQNDIFAKTAIRYTTEDLLRGFEKIANEKMAGAIRKISVSKGFDPKDYALLAFGGAGGLHACKIAALLGMSTVILPYDGGLLSAFGIGQAQVGRFAQKQVLLPLPDYRDDLPGVVGQLTASARKELRAEGFAAADTVVKSRLIYLRLKGQESTLELPFDSSEKLEAVFEKKYRQLFGHYPGNRPVEVESVKVVVASRPPAETERPQQVRTQKAEQVRGPVLWDELAEGGALSGPAVLLNRTSTAFLEEGWQMVVRAGKNLVLRSPQLPNTPTPQLPNSPTRQNAKTPSTTNPIELELFTNRFAAIAEEMGAQLQRTAFSVNIKERLDFSCALLDAGAELLVNAPHIPVHLGSLGICARLVKEKLPLGPGDVIITNHPKYGGSHLPDVTLLSAVFAGEPAPQHANTPKSPKAGPPLIGYVINRAHHAEIGGSRPGSMPPDARVLEEEGVVIPPTYLVKNGTVQWQTIEEMLIGSPYPTRSLHENLADINAALASLRTGEEKLKALAATHGLPKVQRYMQRLKQTAAEALGEALRPFEGRHFSAIEKLDDGREIHAAIAIANGGVTLDFSGSGPVHPFNLNAGISIVYSAVIYVLRLLCRRDIPLNEGLMQQVNIVLPPGSFLHPDFSDNPARCPAVVGGNTEVSQRLVDTLLKALAPITRTACSQGTMNNLLFGNENFGYYETICGGTGAGEGFHGRSGVHQHMTNTKITDPEELELRYPVRLHRFGLRPNSGGEGQWSGGNGVVREMEFLEEVDLTLISQHRQQAPYSLAGGKDGAAGRQYLVHRDGKTEKLNGVDSRHMKRGERIIIETPGGGGYGPEPEAGS